MTELTMPRLTDSMEQGTILSWLKSDGEHVQAGEDLLEIETDKATVTHPAEATGVLQIIAPEGTTLDVGAAIARVGATVDTPTPSPAANGGHGAPSAPAPENGATSAPALENGATSASSTAVRATPLARRAAKVHGVSLEDVAGSGPLGRVTREDVLAKAGVGPVEPPAPRANLLRAAQPQPAAPAGKGSVEVVEPTRVQSLIARRMSEAKATVPHFQVQTEVVMDAAVAFREELKATSADAPSLNDLIVKAAALALRQHPLANGSYRDGRFELHSRVNVGIAVAADHALVVPTIFDADEKSLGTIAADARRLAKRVRDGTVTPAELSAATFTVSNLGMHGMTAITPVVNAPQAAILGVGATREVLARVDGEIVDRRLMTLTLSCDHRILYGADAAEFLSTIRQLLEHPLRLAL
jgi:pyruvate dehydrogenase E2 component (dihydrolipoamide acetyltransferase)